MDKEQQNRDRDLMREAARLRGVSPEEAFERLNKLNEMAINDAIGEIKSKHPNVSNEDLSKELRAFFK